MVFWHETCILPKTSTDLGLYETYVYILYNKILYLVTFQRRLTKKFQQLEIKDGKRPQDQLQLVNVLPLLSIRPDDRVTMYDAVNDSRGEKVKIGDYVELTTGTVRVSQIAHTHQLTIFVRFH